MDDLALQVGEIDDVKVHDTERAHARCRKIERQRRSQAAGSDTQHARSFQLLLPGHADLGHDQVARVTQDLVVGKGSGFGFDIKCGGHQDLVCGNFQT